MDIFQAIALALLQGLTEFLPISSSAHLILLPVVVGWKDQGIAFDVAVHIGTLIAVMAYYRKALIQIISAWLNFVFGKGMTEDATLAWYIILGTIPVGLVGLSLPENIEVALRSPLVIATSTAVFALLLWLSDKKAREYRTSITLLDAVIIGSFQAIALIPGTSRSGITITAGLLTGLKQESAARFSFLLSIPVIALAGMLKGSELYNGSEAIAWDCVLIGASVSALVAYLSIGWFLWLLNKVGMLPFVFYRLVLGVFLFAVFL